MKIPLTEAEAVAQFRPFLQKYARRYSRNDETFAELMQEGALAIVLAFRSWSPSGGRSLHSWIWQPVKAVFRTYAGQEVRKGVNRRGLVGPGPGKMQSIPRFVEHVSIDEPLGPDSDLTLHDVLAAAAPDERADFLAARHLPGFLARLPPRVRRVMRLRYVDGLDRGTVGKVLGVTGERIRQIENQALAQLRAMFAQKGISDA